LPTLADATYNGDGTATTFAMPQRNLTSASAFIAVGNTAWSATGATFNTSGQVAFSGVISANSAFRVTYVYSTFNDDEVDHMLSAGGSVMGGAIEACHALMFDSLRRSLSAMNESHISCQASSKSDALMDTALDRATRHKAIHKLTCLSIHVAIDAI